MQARGLAELTQSTSNRQSYLTIHPYVLTYAYAMT
jgi:hypothetical protein